MVIVTISLLPRQGYPHPKSHGSAREGGPKTTALPDSLLPPLPVQLLLPLNGLLPFHLHHVIQTPLLRVQLSLNQLLLQDLGIPDGMALGIEDDLEAGRRQGPWVKARGSGGMRQGVWKAGEKRVPLGMLDTRTASRKPGRARASCARPRLGGAPRQHVPGPWSVRGEATVAPCRVSGLRVQGVIALREHKETYGPCPP